MLLIIGGFVVHIRGEWADDAPLTAAVAALLAVDVVGLVSGRQLLARLPVPAAARHRPVRGPAGPAREPSRPGDARRDRRRHGLDRAVPGRLGGLQRRRPAGVRRARHRRRPARGGRARRHPGRLRRPRRPPAGERHALAVRLPLEPAHAHPRPGPLRAPGAGRRRRPADVDRRVGRLPALGRPERRPPRAAGAGALRPRGHRLRRPRRSGCSAASTAPPRSRTATAAASSSAPAPELRSAS